MISTEQKAILRRIAKEQMASFLRISELEMYAKVMEEMREEGYDVNDSDMLVYFTEQLELWEAILENPEKFQTLDEVNLGMVKHWLINHFEKHPDAGGIWKKINIIDRINKN